VKSKTDCQLNDVEGANVADRPARRWTVRGGILHHNIFLAAAVLPGYDQVKAWAVGASV
jgi:hypothetical protein